MMKKIHLLITLALLAIGTSALGVTWQKIDNDSVVSIWVADSPNSDFQQFKAQVTIDAPMQEIIEFIQNTAQTPNWYYNIISAKLLPSNIENQYLIYSVINLPWPMSNRDSIIEARPHKNADQSISIFLNARAQAYPKQQDKIRVPYVSGHWHFVSLAKNRTQVELQLSAQPGGYIPSWLANAIITNMPLKSLSKLKQLIER